jgi:hypothetical protein
MEAAVKPTPVEATPMEAAPMEATDSHSATMEPASAAAMGGKCSGR